MDVSTVYFPSAIALGALHALEPGHAKTLTAAYLIGTKERSLTQFCWVCRWHLHTALLSLASR